MSDVLVVAEAPATTFTPLVAAAYDASGTNLGVPNPSRVALIENGVIVADPVVGVTHTQPLGADQVPRFQFVRYWVRIAPIESFAGGSDTTRTVTTTRGTSTTQTSTFTETLSVEAESEAGGPFASASVKTSASFTATQSVSSTASTEESVEHSFSVHPVAGTNLILSVWQLVEEYRYVGADGELFDGAGGSRPAIPEPDSYIAEVPLKSEEFVVATVSLTNFNPTVEVAKDDEGNIIPAPAVDPRIQLMLNGNPEPNPQYNGQDAVPLENVPQLQLVRYWQRLGPARRYSGATTTTVKQSVTRGTTTTETFGFGFTIGVETTVSADAIFASASVTVKTEFSGEFETENEITEEQTIEEEYTVSAEQDQNLVFAVWQLVEEYRIVISESGE